MHLQSNAGGRGKRIKGQGQNIYIYIYIIFTPSAFERNFLHSFFFILSFSLPSHAQLSDVGTCTLCDSSTPSTCQVQHGTLRFVSNHREFICRRYVELGIWNWHECDGTRFLVLCRQLLQTILHLMICFHKLNSFSDLQIHPITTARLSVNFKHRHLDENITGSVWCDLAEATQQCRCELYAWVILHSDTQGYTVIHSDAHAMICPKLRAWCVCAVCNCMQFQRS